MTNGWTERIATLEAELEQWKSLCAAQGVELKAREAELADARGRLEECLDAIKEIRDEAAPYFHPSGVSKSIEDAWNLQQAIKKVGG